MKYLNSLHSIDVAIIAAFIPFLFVIPLPMKIFAVSGLYFVLKKQTRVLWVFGFVSILMSFYNFWELSDFKNYLLLLISMLIWGIYLQKTKGENFYLKISPLLFFILSIILFQNIYMLFYVLFEIYVFLFLIVKEKLKNTKTAFKTSLKIYLYSLPLVVLLFLFFPRIHQYNILFGFKENAVYSGFNGVVNTNVKNVKLTSFLVAEFKLKKSFPVVYLRGSVLNSYVNGVWGVGRTTKDTIAKLPDINVYYLKQYPTSQKYIFAVDFPVESDFGKLSPNYTLVSDKNIKKTIFIQVTSAINGELKPVKYPVNDLVYNKKYNKLAQKLAKKIKSIKNDEVKLKKIISLFKKEKIIYSLDANLDSLNIVDSLFKKKRGYCVHFASAFAIFARMCGLPSRIVAGFLVQNPINGYYKVYSKDAHSWVEVLVNGVWKRIDPTNFAYKNIAAKEYEALNPGKFDMYVSYVRFVLEEWILKYDAFKQRKVIKFFEKHSVKFLLIFGLFLVIIFLLVKKINSEKNILSPLYKKLGSKPQKESVYNFLKKFNDKKLDEINELYHKITYYKHSKKDVKKLKKLIKRYKK